MSKKQTTDARRRLIKSLAAGGGVLTTGAMVPNTWVKPVVDSVIMPAHAGFSPKP
ncbi:twin-arginine translocation signal domain-containing protein [Gammaproteobacteria bacterium]|nr:twin-arginine translocation signal domain-containing protein [Gammaproteobacteria bacterium]